MKCFIPLGGFVLAIMSSNIDKKIREKIIKLETLLKSWNRDQENRIKREKEVEWLQDVFFYLLNEEYVAAQEEFFKVLLTDAGTVDEECLSTEVAIMYNMFEIHTKEVQNGKDSVFRNFRKCEELFCFYNELRFLVRRFEYDFPNELKSELLDFIARYSVSEYAILEILESGIALKEKVANEIAVFLLKNRKYEYVLPLLTFAYDLNSQNNETLYNLAYFLYAFNEVELASEYMNSISGENMDIQTLRDIIVQRKKLPEYSRIHKMVWGKEPALPSVSVPNEQQTICFVICVNDERYYQECCHYINQLYVPEGYRIDIVPIYNAVSMTSAYQKIMEQSDAVFKVYLHQDAMCIHKGMLYDALHVFEQDDNIGIIGVAGCTKMPVSGIWWDANEKDSYYNLYQDSVVCYSYDDNAASGKRYDFGEYQMAEALDGVFLMTSKDVDWRQDLFDGWHFYDVSQCMEFIRKGYKVVIPKVEKLWVLHSESYEKNLGSDYHTARMHYLKEYIEDLALEEE